MISVGVIGISHKTAGLALREVVAGGAESLKGERSVFFFYPTVLLSTCNRTEIYFDAEDLAQAHSDLLAFLRARIPLPFEHKLYSYFGIDCFFHLCKVTSGLDSAIFAETEIQRQVKLAYGNSLFLSKCLHFIFQKALKIGKDVRSKIEPLNGSPTLYSALWQMTDWKDRRVLLVGFSEINRGLISYLLHKKMKDLTLCTLAKVQLQGVRVVNRKDLLSWQNYDLIVCATRSSQYLITGKGSSQHVIFDLSVPRSVDPQVEAQLYNIEQVDNFLSKKKKQTCASQAQNLIWSNVVKLSQIYAAKTRHVQGIVEMGSHL